MSQTMKTDVSHLPSQKVRELQRIREMILEPSTHPAEMVILFGSYARGDFVEDCYLENGITYEYKSDFDVLVLIQSHRSRLQNRLAQQWEERLSQDEAIKTPVSIIVHDMAFINQELMKHQYFFSDIKREGILLFDSHQHTLTPVKTLSAANRYLCAKEDFEYWFKRAKDFYEGCNFYIQTGRFSIAAFELHQCTERLYNTILLVFTHYKPKVHALDILRKLANSIDNRFLKAFPLRTAVEKRCFELLCQGYIEARYKKSYRITEPELNQLQQQVNVLEQLTQKLCQEKIQQLEKDKKGRS